MNMESVTNIASEVYINERSLVPETVFDVITTFLVPATIFDVMTTILVPVILLALVDRLWRLSILRTSDPDMDLPLPPGGFGIPFFGETLHFFLWGANFYNNKMKKNGTVYKTHILGTPTIRVIGHENVKKILMGENSIVKSYWPKSVQKLFGASSISQSHGLIHKFRRRLVAKAFSHEALSSYVDTMRSNIQAHINRWCLDGYIFGYPEAQNLMFVIALRTLLGMKLHPRERKEMMKSFEQFSNNMMSLPLNIPGLGLYKGMKARERLLVKLGEEIAKKQPNGTKDALSILMNATDEDGASMTMTELKDTSLELLFTGHDTTASAAATLMLKLGQYPEIVKKIKIELEESGIWSNDDYTYDDLQRLVYCNQVIKEVLRVAPPVGAGFRTVLKTFELGGHQIPKGWNVVYSIRETQFNSEVLGDKDVFDPDRWSEMSTTENRFHYLPFGAGARRCVGQEFARLVLRILLVELVKNSVWKLKNDKPIMKYLPVTHPADNLPLEFMETTPFRRRANSSPK